MVPGSFELVSDRLATTSVAASPAAYWRTGFTLPAVAAGYAFDRESLQQELLQRLQSENIALIGGPGTGKSTACKSVACTWHEQEHGPVYYADTPAGTTIPDLSSLADHDGQTLIVLEDATNDDGKLAVELATNVADCSDISLLLEVNRASLSTPGSSDGLQQLLGDALSVCEIPPLDRDSFTEAVEKLESLTDEALSEPADTVYDTLQDQGIRGNELLHLTHRIVSQPADNTSKLEQTVQTLYDRHSDGAVREDLALLVNVLNAAGLPLYPAFLFALDAPKEDIDDAIGTLRGDLLLVQPPSPPFRTFDRLFSSLFLERAIKTSDRPHEQFARVLRAVLDTMDPDHRANLWEWINTNSQYVPVTQKHTDGTEARALLRSSARPRNSAVGPRAQVVEQIFSIGRSWPVLAPLFGTHDDETLDLAERCSSVTTARGRLTRGRMYFDRGDHEQALAEFDAALAELDTASPGVRDRLCVQCLIASGRVATRKADFERARNYHEEAHAVATDIGDRRGRARSHIHHGVVELKTGALQQATAHLTAGERLFRELDDSHGIGEARQRLGIAHLHRGNLRTAAEVLDDAIDRYQRTGVRVNVAKAQNNRGLVAYEHGDFDAAETYYRRSLASNREIGRQDGVMKNLLNLGNLAVDRGDETAAETHFQEALSFARNVGDRDSEATLLNNLGVLMFERGDFAAAENWYRQSLDVTREIGDRRGEARARNNLGEVARERESHEVATDHHQAALDIYGRVGDQSGQASCHLELGNACRDHGDVDAAAEHLQQALTLFRDIENTHRTGEALAALGRLASRQGDSERAFERFRESVQLLEPGREREDVLATLRNLAATHDRSDWQAEITALSDTDTETVP